MQRCPGGSHRLGAPWGEARGGSTPLPAAEIPRPCIPSHAWSLGLGYVCVCVCVPLTPKIGSPFTVKALIFTALGWRFMN